MPISRPTLTTLAEVGIADGSSPRESFAPDLTSVSSRFRVKFEERWDAVVYFVGYARLATSGGPGTTVTRLERLTPKPHYDAATGTALASTYAVAVPETAHHKATGKSAGLVSSGDGSRTTFYESILTVQYEHIPFEVAEDGAVPAAEEWRRYVYIKAAETRIETLMLPSGSMKYATADASAPHGLPIPFGQPIRFPVTRLTLGWVQLPRELYTIGSATPTAWQKRVFGWPADNIKPLIGRVSSVDWLSWPKGTLLLENVVPIVRRYPTIGTAWDFDVVLQHNPLGWLNVRYQDTTTTSGDSKSGWYFASSAPHAYYAVGDVPDEKALYSVGDVSQVFDVTG